jgi:cytosine/adenosine deaminase-related metal-dependent hydrolase
VSIYLRDAVHVDWRTLKFSRGHIKVESGANGGLFFIDNIPQGRSLDKEDKILDCHGKLVTRAFACGHHHAYSALARGMPAPARQPVDFLQKLQYVWWKLDSALDTELVRLSALATALDCAKNGVTSVIDHHSSPTAVAGALTTIAEAFAEVGINVLPCLELSDRDGEKARDLGLAETENRLRSGKPCLVGLHASFTVGDDLLEKAVRLAEKYGSGIHVHTAEDNIDQERTLKNHGCRVIERFQKTGVLDFKKTILVHGLHLDKRERSILKNSPAWLAENMESNLNNRVGVFSGRGLSNRVMLGTDGMHSDMLQSARAAYFSGLEHENTAMADIYRRLRRGHDYLSENGFGGDAENNLVVLDYQSPTPVNEENFLGHLFYGLNSGHADSVIAQGKLIVENKRILTVDEDEILAQTRVGAEKLWRKMIPERKGEAL